MMYSLPKLFYNIRNTSTPEVGYSNMTHDRVTNKKQTTNENKVVSKTICQTNITKYYVFPFLATKAASAALIIFLLTTSLHLQTKDSRGKYELHQ